MNHFFFQHPLRHSFFILQSIAFWPTFCFLLAISFLLLNLRFRLDFFGSAAVWLSTVAVAVAAAVFAGEFCASTAAAVVVVVVVVVVAVVGATEDTTSGVDTACSFSAFGNSYRQSGQV